MITEQENNKKFDSVCVYVCMCSVQYHGSIGFVDMVPVHTPATAQQRSTGYKQEGV